MDALTQTTWTTVLNRIVTHGGNETTVILAKMLLDIIHNSTDPVVDEILDVYGSRLLS